MIDESVRLDFDTARAFGRLCGREFVIATALFLRALLAFGGLTGEGVAGRHDMSVVESFCWLDRRCLVDCLDSNYEMPT